jgi:hypothetical protein
MEAQATDNVGYRDEEDEQGPDAAARLRLEENNTIVVLAENLPPEPPGAANVSKDFNGAAAAELEIGGFSATPDDQVPGVAERPTSFYRVLTGLSMEESLILQGEHDEKEEKGGSAAGFEYLPPEGEKGGPAAGAGAPAAAGSLGVD